MFKCTELLNFTSLFRSGNPFDTKAVVIDINANDFVSADVLKYFEVSYDEKATVLKYKLSKNDRVYGLGESLGSFNKRGKKYKLYAKDDPSHTPEKESLYSVHPFVIIDGEQTFGFLIDYPAEMIFDIGYTHKDVMEITIYSKDFDIYLFENTDKKEIIKEYLKLTGSPYIPPKWAFGYQQCRWSYPDAKSIREVAENFRKHDIPCDAIYMDIDYMERYKVFTVDENKFPDFEDFVQEMKKDGIKLIPIIDPGVKIEEGYDIYEDGKAKGYFCKDKDGNDFVTAVWPGLTHFPDFINPETRKWWGNLYKGLVDLGVEGFWNDMNEPAIFYTLLGLADVKEKLREFVNDTNTNIDFFPIKDKVNAISNCRKDYQSFYHTTADGKVICHDDVHNLYGYFMALATVEEGFKKFMPEKRYYLLSRSSYTGFHRYAAIWMGDNSSWWEHLIVHIRMLLSLNMAGYFYTGADVAGFGGNTSPELAVRWMQLGAFTPLYRNHSALSTRHQEPWAFDSESMQIMRNIIRLRYALLPYAYSQFMQAVDNLSPFVSPLMLHFDGEMVKDIEDQFMYGDSLMIAPVYTPNARGRFVHLPEVKWLHWHAASFEQRDMKVMESGNYYIEAPIDGIPVFLRENTLTVLTKPVNYVGEKSADVLTVIGLVTDKASFTYYEDDGVTFEFKAGSFAKLQLNVERRDGNIFVSYGKDQINNYPLNIKKVCFEVYDESGNVYKEEINL